MIEDRIVGDFIVRVPTYDGNETRWQYVLTTAASVEPVISEPNYSTPEAAMRAGVRTARVLP